MDKLKMHSPDMTQQNIEKIQALFPNCVTESRGVNGELKLAIDFDQLKQELSNSIVEGPQERYHLNWPGKREALYTSNASVNKTLRPIHSDSLNFDLTKNLYVEGDNLDALKILSGSYFNRVKVIYIDPPYNTGSDFVYSDNFTEKDDSYLQQSEQKDFLGNRYKANLETDGRFHSNWLTMMYSRLRLARNFLVDDGVIFVSIGVEEFSNLKK
ncbi:site-specific DNA-methyltransferase [Vibrio cholerae]|nr:site-specific DNA-methyltransferase [Vibrio cholerae]EKF9647157.1 site-specific DNA-methyltransferase [Vibrio cholerae]EKF9651158.1 site-specific DNA-methyltransferase [Vibrio cholerae]